MLPRMDTTGVCFLPKLFLEELSKGLHRRRPQLLLGWSLGDTFMEQRMLLTLDISAPSEATLWVASW